MASPARFVTGIVLSICVVCLLVMMLSSSPHPDQSMTLAPTTLSASASSQIKARYVRECAGRKVRVMSDVDDTVAASGGVLLGGEDRTFRHGTIYPGVAEFMLGLAKFQGKNPLDVILLSARPRELKSVLGACKFCAAFEEAGKQGGAPSWGINFKNTLFGSVNDAVHKTKTHIFTAMGLTKDANEKKFIKDHPGDCVIFVGDNGQGDALAAHRMLSKQNTQVAASFVHDVTKTPVLKTPENPPLIHFSTYPEAAVKAWQLGMMTKAGAQHVVTSAMATPPYKKCTKCSDPCGTCQSGWHSYWRKAASFFSGKQEGAGGCASLLQTVGSGACCQLGMACCNPRKVFSCQH